MPTIVTLPSHSSRNIITTSRSSWPRGSPWVPYGISFAAAAALFSLSLVLLLTVRHKRQRQIRRRAYGLGDHKPLYEQYHLQGNWWNKSRGVSSIFGQVMSAGQSSPRVEVEIRTREESDSSSSRYPRAKGDRSHEDSVPAPEKSIPARRHFIARPPPPLPLTPPTLDPQAFPFEDRRRSTALSSTDGLDTTFFRQPNPDYTVDHPYVPSSISTMAPGHASHEIPRRRSYTKIIPTGAPQPVSILEEDGTITPFSPSSFPSSNPILPLAPHDSFQAHGVDVRGEIISVMDSAGAGWKRHTRVYGGGVCLACLAAGEEGGFYGDRVRPEEKR